MRRWVLLVVALTVLLPHSANAQCGAKSSTCRACHEVRKEGPAFDGSLPWHRDHAFADLCPSCHGGDGQAKDAALAHAGRMAPLADVSLTCGLCHGDGAARAAAYPKALPVRDAGPSPATPPAVASTPPRNITGNRAFALVALVLGAFGSGVVARNERRRRSSVPR
jgi:hypothetical protein